MMTTTPGGYVPRPGDRDLMRLEPGELIVPGTAVLDGSAAELIRRLRGDSDA